MKDSKKAADAECRGLRKRWTTDRVGSVMSLLGAGSVDAPTSVRAESKDDALGQITHGIEIYLDLRGWNFTSLSHARLERVDISCGTMSVHGNFGWDTILDRCIARNLTLRTPSVFGDWRHCDLSGAIFDKVDVSRASFAGCDFSGATLKSCVFVGCSFEDCVLDNTSWTRGRMSTCTFTRTTFRGWQLDSLEVSSCTFIDCRFENVDGRSHAAANSYQGCVAPIALMERDALDDIATGDYRRLLRANARAAVAPFTGDASIGVQLEDGQDPSVISHALLAWMKAHGGTPIVRLASAEDKSKEHEWQEGDEYLLFPLDDLVSGKQPRLLASAPPALRGVVRYSRDAALLRAVTRWSADGARNGVILVEESSRSRVYLHWTDIVTPSGKEQRWWAITVASSPPPFDPYISVWLTADQDSEAWERREYQTTPEGISITTTDSNGNNRTSIVRLPS